MNRLLKKTLILTGFLIAVAILSYNWYRKDTKKHSPASIAEYQSGDLNIKVNYCRPYAKGRVIFGEEVAGALQPYGKYWRLGANEATTFEINQTILFNGNKELAPGKYALYAYPGPEIWTLCVNKDWDRWGAQEADKELDVFRTTVKADNTAPFQEQFEIEFENSDQIGNTVMTFRWDKVVLRVPIHKK